MTDSGLENSAGTTPSRVLSRRALLLRAAALGAAAPVATALLAACGGAASTATTVPTIGPTPTIAALPTAAVATAPAATAAAAGGASPAAGASPTTAAASPAAAGGTPKRGGAMTIVGHQELAGLSPNDVGPGDQWVMITQIHNALLEIDENFVFQPVLAESFSTSPDGLTYTFKLRQGVKFQDGTDFTSADVKYTYDFYRDANNGSVIANGFLNVESVEAPDPYTTVVKMSAPNAAFIARGASTYIVQSKYHAQVGEKKYRTAPIGTGPFKLKEWVAADHTTVEAFDQHFRGRPYLDTFTQNVVPEASVRTIALQTGKADSSCWVLLVADDLKLTAQTQQFTTFQTLSTAVNHFPINNARPFFADKQVRQALLHGIDRQKLIDSVFQGAAVLATGNLAPNVKAWYNPNVTKYDYDPAKAKAMLDAAGWTVGADGTRAKGGQKFSFTCFVLTGDQARKPEAEIVQQQMQAIGVDMKIQEAPASNILAQLVAGKMDASLFNWTYGDGSDPDASDTLRSNGGNNFTQYKNPQMDQLLDNGLKEVDPQKRKAIYDQIQQIVSDDVPFFYVMYWNWFNHFTKRIQGLPKTALNGSQLYAKAYQWWTAE
ncbi:MAG TPA: ABC transporter substrate-binding protein [Thermomicrobiales bacterium]|nr:ABC transporter substrate-binding protein [Thermomicrobiales bacterium]